MKIIFKNTKIVFKANKNTFLVCIFFDVLEFCVMLSLNNKNYRYITLCFIYSLFTFTLKFTLSFFTQCTFTEAKKSVILHTYFNDVKLQKSVNFLKFMCTLYRKGCKLLKSFWKAAEICN